MDLLRTNQDQEEMTRDQSMLYGRITKFVRLGGFSSTSQGNFWPDLHRNCLRGDR